MVKGGGQGAAPQLACKASSQARKASSQAHRAGMIMPITVATMLHPPRAGVGRSSLRERDVPWAGLGLGRPLG